MVWIQRRESDPDIHGILVLPDDGKTVFLRMGRATLTVRTNAGDFVRALQEAFPESAVSGVDCPSIRRAVRVLNLAEISTDPIAKVVLAISTIEGLAAGPSWTDVQKRLIESAAAWLERTHGDGEESGQVVEAIQRNTTQQHPSTDTEDAGFKWPVGPLAGLGGSVLEAQPLVPRREERRQ